MGAARLLAQAKVNLFLRVLARDVTGFHQVETLYCRLALGDDVTVRAPARDRSLDCDGEGISLERLAPVEDNLAWRAASAYRERAGWPSGFAIGIRKRIPVGAGLGGGSADAGAVLRGLNALNPRPVEPAVLMALAGSLGADVPFLTQDLSPLALGWGRGERLLALPPLPARRGWVFMPSVSVSTHDAYQWIDQDPQASPTVVLPSQALRTWPTVAEWAHNDFERPVASREPVIARLLNTLRSRGAASLLGTGAICLLSGSGSAVVALVGTPSADGTGPVSWRVDEPGLSIIETATAERVEPVVRID
jgi:4-diphosphocytidyl-2-C-methyl-D-erythritol kinase